MQVWYAVIYKNDLSKIAESLFSQIYAQTMK